MLRIEYCYFELILFNINELIFCVLVGMCFRIYSFNYNLVERLKDFVEMLMRR